MCMDLTIFVMASSDRKSYSNKAVADGALSFYLDHRVSARVAKKTYGLSTYNTFEPGDVQHRLRAHKQFTNAVGDICLGDIFSIILPKVCQSQIRRILSAFLRVIIRKPVFQKIRNFEKVIAVAHLTRLV